VNASAVRKRQEQQAAMAERDRAAQATLVGDRQDLRKLVGENDLDNLSTDELKAAIRMLEGESSRASTLIRKALTSFRADNVVEDAAMTIKGILATAARAATPPIASVPVVAPSVPTPVSTSPVASAPPPVASPTSAAPTAALDANAARRARYLEGVVEQLTQLKFTKFKPARFGPLRYAVAYGTAAKGSMGLMYNHFVVAIEEPTLTSERLTAIETAVRAQVKLMAEKSNDWCFVLCVLLTDSASDAVKHMVRGAVLEKSGWFSNPSTSTTVIYDASDDYITFPDDVPKNDQQRFVEIITNVLTPMAP